MCSDPREGEFIPALPQLPPHTRNPARPTHSCRARLHNFWGHHEKTMHRHHHHAKDPAPGTLLMPGEAGKQDHGAEGLHGLRPPA